MKGFKKKQLRAFIQRRRINALALYILTFFCALTTIVCAIKGFARTDILGVVTALMIALCFIQEFKLRKGFRTMKSFKGFKKRAPDSQLHNKA